MVNSFIHVYDNSKSRKYLHPLDEHTLILSILSVNLEYVGTLLEPCWSIVAANRQQRWQSEPPQDRANQNPRGIHDALPSGLYLKAWQVRKERVHLPGAG